MWDIRFLSKSKKEFLKLKPNAKEKTKKALTELSKCFPKCHLNIIKMVGHSKAYRLRVGDYRILFAVFSKEKVIIITRIKLRKKAYK